jgi:hypothetical protein
MFVQRRAPVRGLLGATCRYPLLGRSVQVDPAFGYYKDRSPESIAAEIRANGYSVVHYVVTSADKADPNDWDAQQKATISKTLIEQQLGGVPKRATGPIASSSPYFSAEVERYDFNLQKANQQTGQLLFYV